VLASIGGPSESPFALAGLALFGGCAKAPAELSKPEELAAFAVPLAESSTGCHAAAAAIAS
jgi:hypothetical protein